MNNADDKTVVGRIEQLSDSVDRALRALPHDFLDDRNSKSKTYYDIMLTYIRELSKAHKGIRRLVRRNRKLEAACLSLQRILDEHDESAYKLLSKADERLATLEAEKQSLRVGQYEISPFPDGGYWIEIVGGDGQGEGMQTHELAELIDKFYSEKF